MPAVIATALGELLMVAASQTIKKYSVSNPPPFQDVRGEWHVLHTRSRQEKALADELAVKGICHFLPAVRHKRVYGSRKFIVDLPLFPGYLFVKGSLEQAYEADRTHRVARIIPVVDQVRLEWELSNLWLALDNGVDLDPYPYLTCGTLAEVRCGPLRGLQGFIESRANNNRLVLKVEMLGRSVSLEVDGALLDPL